MFDRKLVRIEEAASLPRVGKHSLQIIQVDSYSMFSIEKNVIGVLQDILENETSEEVEKCSKSEWFQCMEVRSRVLCVSLSPVIYSYFVLSTGVPLLLHRSGTTAA